MHHPERTFSHPRDVIRYLRELRGFTSDRALAIAAGINQPTLARYLNGTNDTMDTDNLQALAKALDVTTSELLLEVPLGQPGNARLRELAKAAERLPEHEQNALLAAAKAMEEATKRRQ